MKRHLVSAVLLALIWSATALQVQDLSGTWRSSAPTPRAMVIGKTTKSYRGFFYVLNGDAGGTPVSELKNKGGGVHFSLVNKYGVFDGTWAADGKSFSGIWQNSNGTQNVTFVRAARGWIPDPAPHKIQRITVEKGVSLEVLDWGGNGPPLVMIPGSGNTAHALDSLAVQFTSSHHVYGITRRGWGESDMPPPTPENYDGDRLGDDVLAVMDALKIEKAVLVGHSFGGSELSSIGTRHPERVAGLIYLEGAYGYAFYLPDSYASVEPDVNDLRRALTRLPNAQPSEIPTLLLEIRVELSQLDKGLRWYSDYAATGQDGAGPAMHTPEQRVVEAMALGERKYSDVKPPILAVFATPKACVPSCDDAHRPWSVAYADALEKAYPTAHIVRLPLASHYVWRSNEADVLREMNAFIDGLPHR